MGLYCGIDLSYDNSHLVILDERRQPVLYRELPNSIKDVLQALDPFRDCLDRVAVGLTLDWYWIVDGLIEAGYQVHLVNKLPLDPGLGSSPEARLNR